MPRLNHKKTRSGCQRCKARKVKCDESRPKCSACTRHSVNCEYARPLASPAASLERRSQSNGNNNHHYPLHHQPSPPAVPHVDHNQELRLMHEWTAYTCRTFSTAWEFWCYQAPTIALDYRYVMDALLAMSALHASRRPPSQWISSEGRMLPVADVVYRANPAEQDLTDHWKHFRRQSVIGPVANAYSEAGAKEFLAEKRNAEMLTLHRFYFGRSIEGYQKALSDLTIDNIESVFVASILVSFNALFTLSESDETTLPTLDPSFWLRLGRGSKHIITSWREMVGHAWVASSGVFYGKPDLSDEEVIFAEENSRPFKKLLSFAEDFEAMTADDRESYSMTLNYIGGIYKGIVEGTDSPLATCRRLSAMPSRVSSRFVDLVQQRSPRAMVMLAHVFASMKLVDQNAVWFRGIAERQVPIIYDHLPTAWREMMAWPMAVVRGEVEREPRETQIDASLGS